MHLVLRLRGGGGLTITAMDHITGAVVEFGATNNESLDTLARSIAKKIDSSVKPELIKIHSVYGKDFIGHDLFTIHYFEDSPCEVIYGFAHDFKAIIKLFRTSGAMQDAFLGMLTVDNAEDLVEE